MNRLKKVEEQTDISLKVYEHNLKNQLNNDDLYDKISMLSYIKIIHHLYKGIKKTQNKRLNFNYRSLASLLNILKNNSNKEIFVLVEDILIREGEM